MAEVVQQLSERLAARGHQVTVATSRNPARTTNIIAGVKVKDFAIRGKSALGIWGEKEAYQRYLLQCDADIVVNFAAQQWATDLALPVLKQLRGKKIFVPTGFSALGDPLFKGYFSAMGGHMRTYDACVFLSNSYRDIEFARSKGVEKITVIPNGASREEFDCNADDTFRDRFGIPKDDFLVLHVAGYLSESKGQADAIRIFSDSSLSNSTLMLVSPGFSRQLYDYLSPLQVAKSCYCLAKGKRMQALPFPVRLSLDKTLRQRKNSRLNRRIISHSLSRADTVSAYLAADLLLFPSWIECSPIVLFEAAASRTPFLVTDVGNSSEIISWTGSGQLLPGQPLNDAEGRTRADIAQSTMILNELYQSPDKRKTMSEKGYLAWRQYFTWEHITDRYERLYVDLLKGRSFGGSCLPPPSH
jgi:glycosyltransferase involved in cell wall biosynthesis